MVYRLDHVPLLNASDQRQVDTHRERETMGKIEDFYHG